MGHVSGGQIRRIGRPQNSVQFLLTNVSNRSRFGSQKAPGRFGPFWGPSRGRPERDVSEGPTTDAETTDEGTRLEHHVPFDTRRRHDDKVEKVRADDETRREVETSRKQKEQFRHRDAQESKRIRTNKMPPKNKYYNASSDHSGSTRSNLSVIFKSPRRPQPQPQREKCPKANS